jgi:hypothetical protein
VKKGDSLHAAIYPALTLRYRGILARLNCSEIVITHKQKGVFISCFLPVQGLYNNKYKLTVLS